MKKARVLLPAHIDAFHLAVCQEPGVMPNCLSLRPRENVGGIAQEVAGACRLDTVEVFQFFPAEFQEYFKGRPNNATGAIIRIYAISVKYHMQCCIYIRQRGTGDLFLVAIWKAGDNKEVSLRCCPLPCLAYRTFVGSVSWKENPSTMSPASKLLHFFCYSHPSQNACTVSQMALSQTVIYLCTLS